jgi:hypothetical protein
MSGIRNRRGRRERGEAVRKYKPISKIRNLWLEAPRLYMRLWIW